ncbi:MAG TPA: LamG-like jellyroll fold domain-containing protein [Lacipirellula sp.]
MTAPGAPDEKLEPLLEQLFVDSLAPEACDELRSMLAADLDAQRRYAEVVHMREGLAYLLSQEPMEAGAHAAPRAAGSPADHAVPSIKSPGSRPPLMRHLLPTWAAAASVLMAVGLASALAYHLGARGRQSAAADSQFHARPVVAAPLPLMQSSHLGKVSGLSLDASAHGLLQSMQVGQELRCGEVVQLSSGFVRIELNSGAQLIIEGPAEFSLVGEDRVFVRTGRLAASEGSLLIVQTPLLTAECRDARASFDVDDDDTARVFANSGVVTLYSTPQQDAVSHQLSALRAGEGMLVSPGARPGILTTADAGPLTAVVESWEQVESRLRPYERLILADRPLAYWPLYQVRKNRRVLDLTQNGFDGLPVGNWPADSVDHNLDEPRGAYFNGECYIEPDRKPPFKPQGGFAIEGWAKVEGGPQFQSVFTSRWVLRSHEPDCQMFGFTLYAGDKDNWEFWSGNGRKGDLWQILVSPAPVRRGEWAHVVATFTPTGRPSANEVEGTVRMYVDGRQVAEAVHPISLTEFEWPARIGAAEFVPRYLTSWLFKGELRDIALYDYPLEASEIEEHFDAGRDETAERTSALPGRENWLMASLKGVQR